MNLPIWLRRFAGRILQVPVGFSKLHMMKQEYRVPARTLLARIKSKVLPAR